MSEPIEILRACIQLLRRLSGAGAVSLYMPPGPAGERELLVHDGRAAPLPELLDAEAAARLHRDAASRLKADSIARLASRNGEGVLYRIPLRAIVPRPEEEGGAPERRKAEVRPRSDSMGWVGLRFEQAAALDALGKEPWWDGVLALAAAFAAHARSISRALSDQVTGLPDRSEFQLELEASLAHAKQSGRPLVLLLVGPDDFGWVNERLDRGTGDRVLGEISTGLRAGLRSQDHVARYGGAIFTVILSDTRVQDGQLVAENVVRRLGDHRYHSGVLRLEFSAGVAVGDPAEPVDADELIRRADQALSAAKRGQAGSVRIWEKGSDVERAASLDRLQGIFTGDRSKDYRNMGLLLDQIAVVAGNADPAELARRFSHRLFEALHAQRVGVLERSGEGFELLGGIERTPGGAQLFHLQSRDLLALERALSERSFVVEGGTEPGSLSLCALPLLLQERGLGGIVLEVTSVNLSFAGSDRKFLDALASQLAVALDRARLVDRERLRQREEKERLEAEVEDLRRVVQGSRLAYRSAEMESVLLSVRKVAGTDTTVLITGESGTGKEMLAHTLHELSPRRERPLVVVDCGAISPALIESELFGHERGAFTGAHVRKLGRLAQADGTTVFLDEIGELPLDLQSKLLRFVQEKQLTPVGGVATRTVDVRIVAATNVDLRARVAEGRFREDLFHRLNVVRLQLPPLRERSQDIVHLAGLFLQQFSALYRRPAQRFTAAAEAALLAHGWPGNVRELQNMVLTTVLFCDAREVDVADLRGLPDDKARGSSPMAPALTPVAAAPNDQDAAQRLRKALSNEIVATLASARSAPAPIGKWLIEDLILTADRLADGRSRRGSQMLGVPDTTYRRQLRSATGRRKTGLDRSPTWSGVEAILEDFIRSRSGDSDLCELAEACLLQEVESAAPASPRAAAALLGVTPATLFRRKAQLARRY
jgi:diguanylate cyclase (GGDEF)-like protein